MSEPGTGEFYYDDLIDLVCADESGVEVGTVVAVENFGAGDLLEIKPKNSESFYLPYRDEYVLAVSDTITVKDYEMFLS